MMTETSDLKSSVKAHWERETCGTRYSSDDDRVAYFTQITEARYRLEPYIPPFADFASAAGKQILEIGVGAGSDFENWCRYAAHATGVDLTNAAIDLTGERLSLRGVSSDRYDLRTADAEALPFEAGTFDIVYSWGVLHHTPNTPAAMREVARVLKPGGQFRGMIYHSPSWTGWMLGFEYMVRKRKLWFSPTRAVGELLESPGTKVYSLRQARALLAAAGFPEADVRSNLAPGDLLTVQPSERYQGRIMRTLWRLYPRPVIRLIGDRFGTNLLMTATKP